MFSTFTSHHKTALRVNRASISSPSSQPTPLSASSPPWLEDFATRSAQAWTQFAASQHPSDDYESAKTLMQLLETICNHNERLGPDQPDFILVDGAFRGRKFLSVLMAEIFRKNVELCFASRKLEVWDIVEETASVALEIAETNQERFWISERCILVLRVMRETAREQMRLNGWR